MRTFDSIQFQGSALSKIEGNPIAQHYDFSEKKNKQKKQNKTKQKQKRLGFFGRPGAKVQESSMVPPRGAKGDIRLRKVSYSGMLDEYV